MFLIIYRCEVQDTAIFQHFYLPAPRFYHFEHVLRVTVITVTSMMVVSSISLWFYVHSRLGFINLNVTTKYNVIETNILTIKIHFFAYVK